MAATLLAAGASVEAEDAGQDAIAGLEIGDGWGCAHVQGAGSWAWQCWVPASHPEDRPRARCMPWLADGDVRAGQDRVCVSRDRDRPACFQAPALDGRAMPPSTGKAWDGARYLFPRSVGGGFFCDVAAELSCFGDDAFGQLGAPPGLPVQFADGPGRVLDAAVGRWHACAIRPIVGPGGREVAELACWGRGDVGQLGARATDTCTSERLPCARRPQRVPLAVARRTWYLAQGAPDGDLRIGDLFTCVRQDTGVRCWGCSRDGFFGQRQAAPAALLTAWPARSGPVRAPHAACSLRPALVRASTRFNGQDDWADPPRKVVTHLFDVGPRGICLVSEHGSVWCGGAVPTPPGLLVNAVAVSRGDAANACAIAHDGRLYCWGEGYSPPAAPGRPVQVLLEKMQPPPANPRPSPIDFGPSPRGLPWGPRCLLHRTCSVVARSMPLCGAIAARTWDEISKVADTLIGQRISVRGRLGLVAQRILMNKCDDLDPVTLKPLRTHGCCGNRFGWLGMKGAQSSLILDGLGCSGDDSRLCCDVAPLNGTVVATGRLAPTDKGDGHTPLMLTDDVALCLVAP